MKEEKAGGSALSAMSALSASSAFSALSALGAADSILRSPRRISVPLVPRRTGSRARQPALDFAGSRWYNGGAG